MSATAALFPGQGSLTAEAAADARARCPELVERAIELVGEDPFPRAAESTRFAQPAIFLASLAGWRALDAPEPAAFAGHSLGELTALTAAGAFAPETGLELVVTRGELSAEAAAAAGTGGMLAVLGGEPGDAARLADAHGLAVANDNAPGQVVLSGTDDGVRSAIAGARAHGLRALRLDVAAAFHSPAMRPAVAAFERAVAAAAPAPTAVPVVSGLTAHPFTDVARELARALVAPVRWREVMARLSELGATDFVDVGPGRVLARLVARNVPEVAGAPG